VDLGGNNLKNLVNFSEKFCDTYGRKRKKMSMGLYDFDTISGPLVYDASREGEFIPLGSSKKATFKEIIQTHEKGLEYSEILAKSKAYPYLMDTKNILALIPIVNSEGTKVTQKTKNILIDVTASTRHAAESAINLFACSFMDVGAEVYPCRIIYRKGTMQTPQLDYRTIRIRKSRAENTLGFWLDDNKVVNLVNKLGHVAAKYGRYTLVYVPPYRLDVMNYQDIIEDIAIAYGYENIAPMPIMGSAIGTPDKLKEYINRASRLMVGLGFSEAMNTYLTNEDLNFRKFCHEAKRDTIQVEYAKTESITMLRTVMLPSLLENLSNSIHERMPQKLFEADKVFRMHNGKPVEGTNIAIVSEHSRADYSEAKSVALKILQFAGIGAFKLEEYRDPAFISGRAASIIADGKKIGHFGEISPRVLRNFRLEEPVVAIEMDMEEIYRAGIEHSKKP
jgi:phenylalanyl-tRNA synthetase beta chain